MKLIVDTHLHIYPLYDMDRILNQILSNLTALQPDAVKVACLTEGSGFNVFEQLRDAPPAKITDQFHITNNHEDGLRITPKGEDSNNPAIGFHLLPGQQVITKENIEVLALNTPKRITEKNSAIETVNDILACGGLPVVAWSPGKWFAGRGRIVSNLLNTYAPNQMALGDTTLRPYGWLTPLIMRRAKRKGFRVLCGSDPLPFSGEEQRAASYASIVEATGKQPSPAKTVSMLLNSDDSIIAVGRRGSIFRVALRILGNAKSKKARRAPNAA